MTRITLLVALCLILCASPARAQSLSDNAALQYWQAIASLDVKDADQTSTMQNFQTVSIEQARKLVDPLPLALKFVSAGAGIKSVAWGIPYESQGLAAPLVHLGRMRDLARLSLLRVRVDFADKNYDQAIARAADTLRMARHTGNNESLISTLVEYSIEFMIIETLMDQVPSLPAPQAAKLQAALKAVPPRSTMALSIQAEKNAIIAWLRMRIKTGSLHDTYQLLTNDDKESGRQPQEVKDADLAKLFETSLPGLQEAYDQAIQILQLPAPESYKQAKALEEKCKVSSNFLVRCVMPSIAGASRNQMQLEEKARTFQNALTNRSKP
jgi:hypothetical protein